MELDGWSRNFQPESPGEQSSQQVASPSRGTSPLHPSLPRPKMPGSFDDDEESSDTDAANGELVNYLQNLCITPSFRRYFGKSSGVYLLGSAMSVKSKVSNGQCAAIDPEWRPQRRHDFWHMRPVSFQVPFLFIFALTGFSGNLNVCGLPRKTTSFPSQISSPT